MNVILRSEWFKILFIRKSQSATNLDLFLTEVDLAGQLLPGADVRVLGLLEEAL